MRRFLVSLTLAALATLVATAPAAAKGPSAASLTGPGLDHALPINGEGESGVGTSLGSLVEYGGFFPQVFGQTPDPLTRARPKGDLGPRYRIAYRLPGPSRETNTLVQAVYPYAKPFAVTYMAPGQAVWDGQLTHGGWLVSTGPLKKTLVAAGLPKSPPITSRTTTFGGSFPWTWVAAGAVALVVLLALALWRRNVARFRTVKSTA